MLVVVDDDAEAEKEGNTCSWPPESNKDADTDAGADAGADADADEVSVDDNADVGARLKGNALT